jgi:hypothetical protein
MLPSPEFYILVTMYLVSTDFLNILYKNTQRKKEALSHRRNPFMKHEHSTEEKPDAV